MWEISPLRFPLNRRVIERSLGIIAHSRFVADRVHQANALVPVARIPHGMALTRPADRVALRVKHGIDPEASVVGTFGLVNPCKRLEVVAEALARLIREGSVPGKTGPGGRPLLFLVVGGVADDYDARRVVADAGIQAFTRFVEPADLAEFEEYVALVDAAVNLRWPTLGETSGAVLRLLAAGTATIVSDVGWFAELPDHCTAKVPPGHPGEVDLVAAYLERLLADADLRRRMSSNARAYIAREHPWERAARDYVAFLERVLDEPRRHVRAWEVIRDVARELAEMGFSPDDDWLLPEVAAELAMLSEPVPTTAPAAPAETGDTPRGTGGQP